MGITGLLPIVTPRLTRRHISCYKAQRIGIDGHAWLYQILPCVAEDLFFKLPTKKHIGTFEARLKTLEQQGVIPVVILDGDLLKSKEKTNERRRARKEKCRKEAEYWLMHNNPARAKMLIRQCVSVTREIVYDLTVMLEKISVEYIISPYESDAQLCYLQRTGYIDYILTEDSDLIPYGSTRILYKFDNTFAYEFNRECLEKAKDRSFMDNILDISILSGCDYLDSIRGVGMITAYKLLVREKTVERVIDHLKCRRAVPHDYLEKYTRARKTFLHQIVYDPVQGKRRHLRETKEDMEFLGTLEDVEYRVEDSRNIFFRPSNEARAIKRHFVPKMKKTAESTTKRGRNACVEVDANTESPYFK